MKMPKIRNLTKNTLIAEDFTICRSLLSQARGLMFSKKRNLIFQFKKEKIIDLLISHYISFYERSSSQMRFLTPLFLSLKFMVQQNKDLRAQFLANENGLKTLLIIVSQSYYERQFSNV